MTLPRAAARKTKARLLSLIVVPVLAVAAQSALADAAAPGPWTVRVRAIRIDTADKSDAIPSLAVPADDITVSKKWAPDIDFEYAFSPQLSLELLLTIPQKHSVTVEQSALGGPVRIGSFKHLPPTLTLKYRPLGDAKFSPYIGAGINYTRLMSVKLAIPTVGTLRLENDSFGLAAQAGMDYKIDDRWSLSLDLKYVAIGSDVTLGGTKVSHVKVNPLLIGIGAGYRF